MLITVDIARIYILYSNEFSKFMLSILQVCGSIWNNWNAIVHKENLWQFFSLLLLFLFNIINNFNGVSVDLKTIFWTACYNFYMSYKSHNVSSVLHFLFRNFDYISKRYENVNIRTMPLILQYVDHVIIIAKFMNHTSLDVLGTYCSISI